MWNDNTGTTRFYYTMRDISDVGDFAANGFYAYLKTAGLQTTDTDDEHTTVLFKNYVWPVFQDAVVGYVDVPMGYNGEATEPTNDEIKADAKPLLMRIWQWLTSSKERYGLLLNYYEQYKTKLMDSLTISTKTRFNDTPQAGGDFTTDNYTTNATMSETSQDAATPIARLKEIQSGVHNLYQQWANELEQIRIYTED